MSATASGMARAARFYETSVGKKAIMAVTGLILVGFVFVHMAGNLQIFLPVGEDGVRPIDKYGQLLHASEELLWGARLVLLTSVLLHIWASIQLAMKARSARPVGYVKFDGMNRSYAARTMYWSGPIVGAFIVYHLLHLTTGTVHPDYEFLSVYENMVKGFQNPLVTGFYVLSMVLLSMHLYHGFWSMFQSLGFFHPRHTPKLQTAAKVFAVVIALGNISIPLAIMLGLIK